jgi:hypothetical protein
VLLVTRTTTIFSCLREIHITAGHELPIERLSDGCALGAERGVTRPGPAFIGPEMGRNPASTFQPFQSQVRVLYNRRGRGGLAVRVIDNIFGCRDRTSILEDAFRTFAFSFVLRKDGDQNVSALHLIVVL